MRDVDELGMLDLNLLPKFRALYRRRSVSAAARDLYLTQSAVSNALAKMRILFRDELFVRTPDGMEPTATAHALAEPVEQSLAAVEGALSRLRWFSPAESTRNFAFLISPLAETWLMPHLLELLEREAPNVSIATRHGDDRDVEEAALGGLSDFAIAIGTAPAIHPVSETLASHSLVYMARTDHAVFRSSLPDIDVGDRAFPSVFEPAQLTVGKKPGSSRPTASATRGRSTGITALPNVIERTHLVTIVPEWFAVRCASQLRVGWASDRSHAKAETRLFARSAVRNDPGYAWMHGAISRAAEMIRRAESAADDAAREPISA